MNAVMRNRFRKPVHHLDVFTTGEIARLCRVAPRTVNKWFDKGKLKGYRIPCSEDRRVERHDLVRFLLDHGLPTRGLSLADKRVLVVGTRSLFEALTPRVDPARVELDHVEDAYCAGQAVLPNLAVLDVSALGPSQARAVAGHLDRQGVRCVGVFPEDMDPADLPVFMESFKHPFDPGLLAEMLQAA